MKLKDMPDGYVKRELIEAEYELEEEHSAEMWFDLWLTWEGIQGYSTHILDAVRTLGLAREESK